MFKALRDHHRFNETLFLFGASFLCFSLSIFRYIVTDTKVFFFLNWNLFLAFIPWLLSSIIIIRPKLKRIKIAVAFLLFFWLLFFPNAPYILTDLFHLDDNSTMPHWFDLLLILSFAWTGLLFGFLSLWDIEQVMAMRLPSRIIPIVSGGLLFLGSFGIYIGRYLHWNSWDIINKPFGLLYDIGDRLINPFENPRLWGMTLFMGLFLNMMYWSFRLIAKRMQ
jgi:uncharacterized membrane protein